MKGNPFILLAFLLSLASCQSQAPETPESPTSTATGTEITLSPTPSPTAIPPTLTPTPVPGVSVDLGLGSLFIPQKLIEEKRVPLLILHFHGSTNVMRTALRNSGLEAAILTVERPGLSARYVRLFPNAKAFNRLVASAMKTLTEKTGQPHAIGAPTKIMVSAFSAGFGAVREILKFPSAVKAVSYVNMIDSLHAGFVEQPKRRVPKRIIEKELLDSFLAYAKLAAKGKKKILLTHSSIRPLTYASTTEVADYLLKTLRPKPKSCLNEYKKIPWPPITCDKIGSFVVFGYRGDQAHDHMEQMYHMDVFFGVWKNWI